MSLGGSTFGLHFGVLNEESQLHGTMNGGGVGGVGVGLGTGRPLSSSGTSSASASSATAVAPVSLDSTSVGARPATNSSPSAAGSSPAAGKQATSYEAHSRLIAGYPRLPGFYGSTYSAGEQGALYPATSAAAAAASFYPSLVKIFHIPECARVPSLITGRNYTDAAESQF